MELEVLLNKSHLQMLKNHNDSSEKRKELICFADNQAHLILLPDGQDGHLPKSCKLSEQQEVFLIAYLIECFHLSEKLTTQLRN